MTAIDDSKDKSLLTKPTRRCTPMALTLFSSSIPVRQPRWPHELARLLRWAGAAAHALCPAAHPHGCARGRHADHLRAAAGRHTAFHAAAWSHHKRACGLSDVKSLTSMARPGVRAAVKSCEIQNEA